MDEKKPDLPFGLKFTLWYGAWLVAALCLLPGLLFFPFFPAGLFEFFGVTHHSGNAGGGLFILGWALYCVLTLLAFKTQRKGGFFLLLLILCLLLIMNVVGCRQTLHDIDRGLH
jgi:hypothetical protein